MVQPILCAMYDRATCFSCSVLAGMIGIKFLVLQIQSAF
jgi:hypothetical protein